MLALLRNLLQSRDFVLQADEARSIASYDQVALDLLATTRAGVDELLHDVPLGL